MFKTTKPVYTDEIKALLTDFEHYLFIEDFKRADRIADLLKSLFGIKPKPRQKP